MDLSIIIVNYNTKKLTKNCIDSVINSTKEIDYEIVVVDNSSDETQVYEPSELQKDKVIIFSDIPNNGFGVACNFGARKSRGNYLLFLNSDTLVQEGTIDKCFKYLKECKDIGILGVKTLLKDGTLDHGCKRGFPTPSSSLYYFLGLDKKHPENRKYGAYRQTFIDENKTSSVDAVSGSFMMIPKKIYEMVSGFDEDYFMYGEDIDLCYRVKTMGYSVVYFADAVIIHLKGQSGLNNKSPKVIYHFYNAMMLFYNKHYKDKYSIFTNIAVYTGIKLKYFISTRGKVYREK